MALTSIYDGDEKESSIKSYSVNATTSLLTFAHDKVVEDRISLLPLDNNQILTASSVVEDVITLTTFDIADSGLLTVVELIP
jgi:hypothetical protein